ncbi:helix-turn-helix domain-containing protein [Uruburuella testudinis]|uniref:Helix-turn-helix domain-containing protein n=1 Tax=Uruburuella testudinis TaxID=1282863 RepID=A0ABY4DQ85_9NEIS|nr:helix-turn-helix domain-containing protein [Uruburuella testudinis]UOO80894.1 helix-turn-helix domain-containing protein [Uruburuella testudinis]UOO81152.1 helix-turn-helix domain-containing protein [Uruburuella testudinis]UOO83048.1 helix-turn-helix domain-containing protein [Uruburuella testudinis]
MSKYSLHFKHQAVMRYYALRSQQRTADELQISRTHLRRWIAAYERAGIHALEHPQSTMSKQRKNPFITDKPDAEKTQAELLEEVAYLRAENAYLKKLDALMKRANPTEKKPASSKH